MFSDKVRNLKMIWAPHIYLVQNIVFESTYFLHRQYDIRGLTTLTKVRSSVFHVNVNAQPGLSCLEWVHKGDPVLNAGVEFDAGLATVYTQTGGGVVGRVRATHRYNRQAVRRE